MKKTFKSSSFVIFPTSIMVFFEIHLFGVVVQWLSLLHNLIQQSLKSGFLRRFKSCSRHVGDLQWRGSLTMVSTGNKAKRLSSVNHTTKIIHYHHSKVTFWTNSAFPLRRYDTIKTCPLNFLKFSWVVHYRKICKNQILKQVTMLFSHKSDGFCFHSWLHLLWRFSRKNWFTQ